MQAIIIAGGLGTRLKPFTDSNPKAMYKFNDIPFIEHLLLQIKSFGIDHVLILLGYLPEKIIDYIGNGSRLGMQIEYQTTPIGYETGQRLRAAFPLMEKKFLFMYCDNYCPINYRQLVEDYEKNDSWIQLTAYSNRDYYTKDNLKIDIRGRVEIYDKTRTEEGLKGVDIGYAIINRKAIEMLPEEPVNFEAYIYPRLVKEKKVYATIIEHRYYSVGSWDRIDLTKEFFNKKKVVFVDRDGTLNVRPPKACYVERVEDFVWLEGAKEAIKKLNDNGYMVIIISNQPGIARGRLTTEMLDEIHCKMKRDLAQIEARVDAIYYCPHDWDEGCFCRKPSPGMIYQAQRDYSLDLRNAILIGDDERDLEAASRASIEGILVNEEYTILNAVNDILRREA